MLCHDRLDAVLSVMAMRRGKHVLCEKGLTRTIEEAQLMRKVAVEKKLATQMGNQGSSCSSARRGMELIQDGVIRQVEIIGEAARHVSKDFRKANPGIPWEDISEMCDKLIHDYFGVDLEKVWLTAQEDLPVLKEQIIQILKASGSA